MALESVFGVVPPHALAISPMTTGRIVRELEGCRTAILSPIAVEVERYSRKASDPFGVDLEEVAIRA